jgi:putative addiction module component (TIGR02574 family)
MVRPLKEELEHELLALPRKERAKIALRLIRSLDDGVEEDVGAYWKEELVRRSQEIDSGKARLIPAEEVFDKARRRFPKP